MALELPALHSRPSSATLLAALGRLRQDLSSFESASEQYSVSRFDAREVSNYLTGIISSPLAWLPEDERDEVWDAASRRLSERAGRSAHPAHDRTLLIPHPNGPISITLHEPTLTADRLGHKTWAAGYLLAKRIPLLGSDVPLLQDSASTPASSASSSSSPSSLALILELGAGTGLVGLTLAHHMHGTQAQACLHLTDLEEIIPNLASNVERNCPLESKANEASNVTETAPGYPSQPLIRVFPLDWHSIPSLAISEQNSPPSTCALPVTRSETSTSPGSIVPAVQSAAYEVVIAADVLYGREHPALVARAAAWALQRSGRARAVIEVPRREREGGLVDDLWKEMDLRGLRLVASGEEEGWEQMGREEGRVRCWWGVWRWKEV